MLVRGKPFQPSIIQHSNLVNPSISYEESVVNLVPVWKDWVFAWPATAHWHKSQRHQFMCKHKSLISSLTHPNLFWRLSTKMMLLVVPWKVPWYSAKRTFYELPWGLYKGMPTNTQGQSDIVIHKTNIWNKVSTMPKGLFTTIDLF